MQDGSGARRRENGGTLSLILTFSPGRRNSLCVFWFCESVSVKSSRVNFRETENDFSLSPGERAGVRASVCPSFAAHHDAKVGTARCAVCAAFSRRNRG